MVAIIILSVIIAVTIEFVFAWFMRMAAVRKGYGDDSHVFALCFWLGILGGIYVIALPDLVQQEQNQKIIDILIDHERRNYD